MKTLRLNTVRTITIIVLLATTVFSPSPLRSGIASSKAYAANLTSLPQRQEQTNNQAMAPLGSLLKSDGTLDAKSGFTGSVDPQGWRMVSEPGEAPRFVEAAPQGPTQVQEQQPDSKSGGVPFASGDEYWDDRFQITDGLVKAIAISGPNVYVGGYFTIIRGLAANHIARWNTGSMTWSAVGTGTSGIVRAIAISGSNVYVGGSFTTAGGVAANNIARWNTGTNTWSALGGGTSGTSGIVESIAITGTDVYVGGSFTTAGGAASNIARWNTSTNTWSALGTGTNSFVLTLAISGADVYVGGAFTTAGGLAANRIAMWNTSTNTWSALGSGTNNDIHAMALIGSDVFVGGDFTTAGWKPSINIGLWHEPFPSPTPTPSPTSISTPTATATSTATSTPTAAPDFSISVTPPSRTVPRPGSATYTVILTSLNGFSGNVTLSVSGLPSQTSGSFSPQTVFVPSGGTGTSTLTVAATFGSPQGTFVFTVTGRSGTISHGQHLTIVIGRQ